MRHNKHHASLGVTREHRAALLSNMAASLIEHGRIQTTLTKAKALRPFIEKVITKAKQAAATTEKKDQIHLRRLALADVRNEDAITKLFNETYKEFANRTGGYTRIYKLGAQRQSDAAELYFQPSLRRGQEPVPFVFYYEGVAKVRKTLEAKELSRLLYTIWRRVYRVARPMTSEAFRRMVKDLAGRRVVRELPEPDSNGTG
jgi:large subunit ribosomal protein L17